MTPNIAAHGKSFKGCSAYLLHDKAEDQNDFNRAAGMKPQSSDRVAWTETRNLAMNDPDMASRVMAATAMNAEKMKQQSGIRAGRKSTDSVMHYSLAWHPDEAGSISREDMLSAVDQTLKALGAEDRQALIVAHTDEKHPHVHVMLNRVHPDTGRMLSSSNTRIKLDKWANDYRKARGEEHFCPNRAKKWEAIEAKEKFVIDKRERIHTKAADREALNADDPEARRVKQAERAANARVMTATNETNERHSGEWSKLSADHQSRKKAIYAKFEILREQKRSEIMAKHAPARSQLGKDQWKKRRAWETHEQTLQGRVAHAIKAALIMRKISPSTSRGFVADAAKMLVSTKARNNALASLERVQWDKLSAKRKAEIGAAMADVKAARTDALADNTYQFQAERAQLIERQAEDKKRIQKAWQDRNRERADNLKRLKAYLRRQSKQQKPEQQAFNNKAAEEPERQKRTRKRTRSRGRTQRYE